MTVPFDTDVLLFLVSATSPSGHTQPMDPHAYVSVEQWPLWNPVRWATVPPRSSSQGKEGPLHGLACRQGRLRSDRAAVPGKKIFWSCAWFRQSGRFQFYYYWAFHSAHGPSRYSAARTPSCRLLLRYLYGLLPCVAVIWNEIKRFV